jgi:hypothetical protein
MSRMASFQFVLSRQCLKFFAQKIDRRPYLATLTFAVSNFFPAQKGNKNNPRK